MFLLPADPLMFSENKDELELLNNETKKNANLVRAKLKCEWRFVFVFILAKCAFIQ